MEKTLECPICLDWLKVPIRTLTCSHNFCQNCIEDHLRIGGSERQVPAISVHYTKLTHSLKILVNALSILSN